MTVSAFDGVDCTKKVSGAISSAQYMRNFRITSEGKLKKRYGYRAVIKSPDIKSVYVFGSVILYQRESTVYACDENGTVIREYEMQSDEPFSYFTFANRAYIVSEDMVAYYHNGWFSDAEAYIPTVAIAAPNSGGGTVHESLNLLCNKAKITFSPNGNGGDFVLPSIAKSVISVTENGSLLIDQDYQYDEKTHTLKMSYIPDGSVAESLCVTFETYDEKKPSDLLYGRDFCLYGTSVDSRVFFYGGDNVIYYSDITAQGADPLYIPAENYITVGDGGKVTSLIRHYSTLCVFTDRDAWYITVSSVDYDGYDRPSFPIFPLNAKAGCVRGGGALVDNCPVTVNGTGVYKWVSTTVRDERNAKCISDKISPLLSGQFLQNCKVCDLECYKELWIYASGIAAVYAYPSESWYFFDGIDALTVLQYQDEALLLKNDGIYVFDPDVYTDDGKAYKAIWQSGFADFGYLRRKHLYRLYVSMLPETNSRITVTLVPNNAERVTVGKNGEFSNPVFDFTCIDFSNFTFECEGRPNLQRHRIRLRRFDSLRLVIECSEPSARATVERVVLQ